jgi:hypothetical protein
MMTDTTNATAAPGNPYAAMVAPLRAAFTAAMAPYTNGEAVASAPLTRILMEAVTAADPTPELIGMLCHLVTAAAPDTDTLSIMHRAMGAALGLGAAAPARSAISAPRPAATGTGGATRPGSIGARILEAFAANPGTEFTVTQLAQHVGSGTGATGAAITSLLNRGEAVMTGENPRRYTAPAAPSKAETDPEPAAA